MPATDLLERPYSATARQAKNRAFRRDAVLAAAQAVFAREGLEGATIRAIADASGYTAGAVYAYFPSKEAIYAEILGRSLVALDRATAGAIAEATDDTGRVRASLVAFYEFYRDRPQDFDLGFYLFHGVKPRGLTPELNRELNSRLVRVLLRAARAMARLGRLDDLAAHRETISAMAHLSGLLLWAHSGRLRVLDADPGALVDAFIANLIARMHDIAEEGMA